MLPGFGHRVGGGSSRSRESRTRQDQIATILCTWPMCSLAPVVASIARAKAIVSVSLIREQATGCADAKSDPPSVTSKACAGVQIW